MHSVCNKATESQQNQTTDKKSKIKWNVINCWLLVADMSSKLGMLGPSGGIIGRKCAMKGEVLRAIAAEDAHMPEECLLFGTQERTKRLGNEANGELKAKGWHRPKTVRRKLGAASWP